MAKILDWNEYLDTAAEMVAEGIVMLKNENVFPLAAENTAAVFGRIQLHYYKSGTGSGGMVNVSRVVNIVDGLKEAGVKLDEELLETYRRWDEANPFDLGEGWGAEPWSQKEMPLTDEIVENAAKNAGVAIAVIGRTAGEEQDNSVAEGSYLLTADEMDMLRRVRAKFTKMAVLLNVGNIIDMKWMEEIRPDAVMYIWQGGMTGGTGTAAVLTGKVSPSGKLPDTIARDVADYPSAADFGDPDRDLYREDIYVGYRYFETFAKEKVLYPFGYGLSYTQFEVKTTAAEQTAEALTLKVTVKNIGKYSGKEVVQAYFSAPQGALGKPARQLCAFEKTRTLAPNEQQEICMTIPHAQLASYDDSGASGNINCYVLEAGEYRFFVGTDVRSAVQAASFTIDKTEVISRHEQAAAPVTPFERIKPIPQGEGFAICREEVPLSRVDEQARREENMPAELTYTGDRGIKLSDVAAGRNSMAEFIAQLSDYDLSCIIRGEGMGSPRVTAGFRRRYRRAHGLRHTRGLLLRRAIGNAP